MKAHAGIYGDEIADLLAKECTQNYNVTYSRIRKTAIINDNRKESIKKWQRQWEEITKGEIREEFFSKRRKKTGSDFKIKPKCNNLSSLSSKLLSKNLEIKIYRNLILSVVLYGCETWSLTLREERKLRVFENIVLRRIFGPRRDEITWEWRRLHNVEVNDLYSSPNVVWVIKSRKIRWAGHVARMGEE